MAQNTEPEGLVFGWVGWEAEFLLFNTKEGQLNTKSENQILKSYFVSFFPNF
jgi:hypothetical protein